MHRDRERAWKRERKSESGRVESASQSISGKNSVLMSCLQSMTGVCVWCISETVRNLTLQVRKLEERLVDTEEAYIKVGSISNLLQVSQQLRDLKNFELLRAHSEAHSEIKKCMLRAIMQVTMVCVCRWDRNNLFTPFQKSCNKLSHTQDAGCSRSIVYYTHNSLRLVSFVYRL